jgi:hypothetical protein
LIGSKVPNGHTLDKGISFDLFEDFEGDIYSGDIHMPQMVKGVTFIGSPYPVYFGDDFQGRVILLKNGKEKDLYYPCLKKYSLKINHPEELIDVGFLPGDHVKIAIELHPSESHLWPEYRKTVKDMCKNYEVQVFGLEMSLQKVNNKRARRSRSSGAKKIESPEKVIKRFAEKEGLSGRYLKAAEGLMDKDVGF